MGRTTKFGIPYPELTDTPNVPRDMRLMADAVDTALGTSVPVGAIIAYASNKPPAGWALCDGSAHNSAALATLLGSPNTPNLKDRFIMGTSATSAMHSTGGLDKVTLTAAQSGMPAHDHTATSAFEIQEHTHAGGTSANDADHQHSGTTGAMNTHKTHAHGYLAPTGTNPGWSGVAGTGNLSIGRQLYDSSVENTDHNHPFTTGGITRQHAHSFTTGGRSTFHTHGITVKSATAKAATASHENRPPYVVLAYIIKTA